jgi:hypothetical protein
MKLKKYISLKTIVFSFLVSFALAFPIVFVQTVNYTNEYFKKSNLQISDQIKNNVAKYSSLIGSDSQPVSNKSFDEICDSLKELFKLKKISYFYFMTNDKNVCNGPDNMSSKIAFQIHHKFTANQPFITLQKNEHPLLRDFQVQMHSDLKENYFLQFASPANEISDIFKSLTIIELLSVSKYNVLIYTVLFALLINISLILYNYRSKFSN